MRAEEASSKYSKSMSPSSSLEELIFLNFSYKNLTSSSDTRMEGDKDEIAKAYNKSSFEVLGVRIA